jgi:hypothetical protein
VEVDVPDEYTRSIVGAYWNAVQHRLDTGSDRELEKFNGGQMIRRIETTRVVTDDKNRAIPANLTVRGPRGTVTELDGSRIKHGAAFTDADFTPAQLGNLTVPRGSE